MYGEDDDIPWYIPIIIFVIFATMMIGLPVYLTSDTYRRVTPELLAEDTAKCKSLGGELTILRKNEGKDMGKVTYTWCSNMGMNAPEPE